VSGAFLSSSEAIHNLLGCGDAVIFGGMIFILGMRFGWFHVHVPDYLTVIYYYKNIYGGFIRSCHCVFARLDALYDRFCETLIFGQRIPAGAASPVISPDIWKAGDRLDRMFSEAVDKIIYSRGMQAVADRAGGKQEKGVWKGVDDWNSYYDELVDKFIFSDGIKSVCKDENKLSTAQRKIWQELKLLEEKYGEIFDKAVFGVKMETFVEECGGDKEKIIQSLAALKEKYGEEFDTMMLNKNIQKMIKQRLDEKPGALHTRFWKWFSEFDVLHYNTGLDKFLFGNADPTARPQENWFRKLCRRLSGIHSGDIGHYISWIIVILAIVVSTLIGRFYITSLLGFLIMVTIVISIVIAAIMFS
jgi:hypothetical protein